jgi:hypothetical protein
MARRHLQITVRVCIPYVVPPGIMLKVALFESISEVVVFESDSRVLNAVPFSAVHHCHHFALLRLS